LKLTSTMFAIPYRLYPCSLRVTTRSQENGPVLTLSTRSTPRTPGRSGPHYDENESLDLAGFRSTRRDPVRRNRKRIPAAASTTAGHVNVYVYGTG
jgi:hypothetical protein